MKSLIADALKLTHLPVAITWADAVPEGAMAFKPGKWGCVMWLVAAAAKGKTAACDRETYGCWGGGVGMGFGNQYKYFPGGEDCFCHFLSFGNDQWETGRQAAEQVRPYMKDDAFDHFVHGERYFKDPEMVKRFIDSLPITDIPAKHVVFSPLETVDDGDAPPQTVVLFANPDQLSALVVLANYGRGDNENVIIPYAAGCQTVGIYPYREAAAGKQRAVVGLTDISARLYILNQLGGDLMTFSMPWNMFLEMEENVPGSFLEAGTWRKLQAASATAPTSDTDEKP